MFELLTLAGKSIWRTLKEQRVAWACAITVVVLLAGIFNAPIAPVLVGCLGALALLSVSSHRKRGSRHRAIL